MYKQIFRTIKYGWQRLVRGYDDRLFWGMAEYLDPMVIAHVKNLREHGTGHPSWITQKRWNKILDTILKGMEPEPDDFGSKTWRKYIKDREKALALLAYYWDNLWD